MNIGDIPVQSLEAVKKQDRETWLGLFAEDAVVEDPVGPNDWAPDGKGQQGRAAIGQFYDLFSSFQEKFDYEVHHKVVRGDEVAVFVTMHVHLKSGEHLPVRAINIYRITDSGKIRSLRSFWNAEDGPAA